MTQTLLRPALDAFAASQNKFSEDDRRHTVGASDVGQCEKKTYWTKNFGDAVHGAPRDPEYVDGWGARMRGTFFEDKFWAPAMKAAFGDRLLFAGADQQTFVSGFLSATPDGLLTGLSTVERQMISDASGVACGDCVTVECKTVDPRTNLNEAKAENVYQTHVQMGLIRELTEFKPTHSILSYTDASFWDQGPEFIIAFDQKVFDVAKRRASKIMTATSPVDLKPEGWIGGGRDCEYCAFTKPCGIERRRVPDEIALAAIDPQFIGEISEMAATYKQLDASSKEADRLLKEMQQAIKDRLRDKGLRKVPGVVSWSSVKGRSGWDNAAIREELESRGAVMDDYRTEGEPSDRLQITLKS